MNYMRRRLNIKRLFILLILFISIGFAYLSTNLNINGILNAKGNTWNIYFDNIQVSSESVELSQGDIYPTISNDKTTVNFSVTLPLPGDYYEFTVDTVNGGTLDAIVNYDYDYEMGMTDEQQRYFDYSVTYPNDDYLIYNDYLDSNSRKTYKVRVQYRNDLSEEDLPSSDDTINFSFSFTYEKGEKHDFAIFDQGENVNQKMIALAGNASNIQAIRKANSLTITPTDDNKVSASNSKYPIYMWYDNNNIYWYSESNDVRIYNSGNLFKGFNNLTDITSISDWNTKYMVDAYSTFEGCTNLSDFSPISEWDVSKLDYAARMFKGCTSITNINFLSKWNTISLYNIDNMFEGCSNLVNINAISNWKVNALEYICSTFEGCTSLSDIDILRNWNDANIQDLSGIFKNCTSLSDISALEDWNTEYCRYFKNAFEGCTSLSDVSYLSNWDFSRLYDLDYMFSGCTNLSDVSALNNWNINTNNDPGVFDNTAVTTYPTWYTI